MNKTILNTIVTIVLLASCGLHAPAQSQAGLGSGEIFNPFHKAPKDSSKMNLKVPTEIHQWHIDEQFGTVIPVNADTLQYLFQNQAQTEGPNGEYNILGNMGSPRQSRIFFNRPTDTMFDFLAPYDYFVTRPGELFFTDTKSPYTNLTYHTSGNKVDGDDRFRAYFARNAGKKFGIGGLFDYLYGRGRYDNQSSALMNFSIFSYYRSDRYNYHLLASRYHMKLAENGGITNDDYIKRPEETDGSNSNFTPADIPVNLERSWNRNEVYTAYFTHNYNFGFYKQKEPQALPDSIPADSIMAQNIDEEADEEKEFVRVARITHTLDFSTGKREFRTYEEPTDFYADKYLALNRVDAYRNLTLENRVGLSLCEGFSKWAFADVTAYASHRYNRHTMPDTIVSSGAEYAHRYNEHTIFVGGIIESSYKKAIKYKLQGETAVTGDDLGAFSLEGRGTYNFSLWGKPAAIEAKAFSKNNRPSFYYRHFHSEHYWWDKSELSKEFKSRVELSATIEKTRTHIRAGIENIKNYTYFAALPAATSDGTPLSRIKVEQADENIQVLSATLAQGLKWGILNIDTETTFQHSSNKEILPLPTLNVYANLYIKFKIAKVLNTELGADVRYFTSYYAPDYSPAIGQFCQQNPADKIEIGNYPIASVYANFLLKETRFYVKYQHLNEGSGNRNYFLAPHYPLNPAVLWLGLSWNFYN